MRITNSVLNHDDFYLNTTFVPRRELKVLFLVFFLILACAVGAQEKGDGPLFIQAESLQKRGELTVASGNVSIEIDGLRLDCQNLIYDPKKGVVTADKDCLFSWGGNFATAESLVFDIKSKTAVLTQAAGRSEGVSTRNTDFEGHLYFWADELRYSEERVELDKAILTSCDLEPNNLDYSLNSERVTLYPEDKIIAENTSYTIHGKKLIKVPRLIFPLDPDQKQGQSYFPSVGYNLLDGAFVRNSINYAFNENNYGTARVDVFQNSGLGYGLEHFFDFGKVGNGNIFYFTQQGRQSDRDRFDFRANGNFRISDDTRLALSYNANQSELPGEVSPLNISSTIDLDRKTENSTLRLGANFARSGENDNRSYRLAYNLDFNDRWSALAQADITRSSNEVTQTNRFHYLGSLRRRGDLFESNLSFENTSGLRTFFLNRLPELNVNSRTFQLGPIPLSVGGSFGVLEESPSNFRTERYRFDLRIPDQILETDLGSFHLGGGVRQQFYGSGQEQYTLGARAGWNQDLADHFLFRFDYNWKETEGFTPFQHDVSFDYQVLSGGLELYSGDRFRLSATGAYDLNFNQAFDIITRLDVKPIDGWELTAAANLDPNTGVWRSVDSGIKAQLTSGVSLRHWSIYDLLNGRLTFQNFSLNYEDHDWAGSLTYRGVQNEIFLQFNLKAFPLSPVKIGPDSSLPILPTTVNNAFSR